MIVRKVSVRKAEQVILAPTEGLKIVGLEKYLPELLERRVVAKGDIYGPNQHNRKRDRFCDHRHNAI